MSSTPEALRAVSDAQAHNTQLLLPFVASYLAYRRGESDARNWLTGGTALFAQSAENRFLVTANHVIEEIDRLRTTHEVDLLLCGHSCSPVVISDWEILSRDSSADICTFQIPADFSTTLLNKQLFELNNWPHPRARSGDNAFILGFPSLHREGSEASVQLRFLPISDFIADVGPRRFTVADENNEREILLNSENLEVPAHFGGMSGSPAFRLIDGAQPEFIGVFSEGSDGLRAAFFCSHADVIAANGRLDMGLIPP